MILAFEAQASLWAKKIREKKRKQIEETAAESQSIVVQDNSNPYNTSPWIKSSTNDLAPATPRRCETKRHYFRARPLEEERPSVNTDAGRVANESRVLVEFPA